MDNIIQVPLLFKRDSQQAEKEKTRYGGNKAKKKRKGIVIIITRRQDTYNFPERKGIGKPAIETYQSNNE